MVIVEPLRSDWRSTCGVDLLHVPHVRALIYTRQSLDRSGDGLAVARQEQDCVKLCAARDWTVIRKITDNDVSASTGKPRPGFGRYCG